MKKFSFLFLILLLVLTGCSESQIDSSVENSEVNPAVSTADVLPDESGTSSFSTGNESIVPDTTEQPKQSTSPSETNPATKKAKEVNTSKQQNTQPKQSSTPKKEESTSSEPSANKPSSSSQKPVKTEPPKEKPKSAYEKPFDTGTMKSELISYGKSIGMTHITNLDEDFGGDKITPDNSTWLPPIETWNYSSSKADKLKQDICDDIKHWKNRGVTTFTLWFEKDSSHSGNYIIYVLIG